MLQTLRPCRQQQPWPKDFFCYANEGESSYVGMLDAVCTENCVETPPPSLLAATYILIAHG